MFVWWVRGERGGVMGIELLFYVKKKKWFLRVLGVVVCRVDLWVGVMFVRCCVWVVLWKVFWWVWFFRWRLDFVIGSWVGVGEGFELLELCYYCCLIVISIEFDLWVVIGCLFFLNGLYCMCLFDWICYVVNFGVLCSGLFLFVGFVVVVVFGVEYWVKVDL